MIKAVLFDVGDTLIRQGAAIENAAGALNVVSGFQTASGDPLQMGIVSDFKPVSPPRTDFKLAQLEEEFCDILKAAGLAEFFEPFDKKVTTSTRAGVNKPDRQIFELAVNRLGIEATLAECLFVTENISHLLACSGLGMNVVRYGSGPGIQPAFVDWQQGPAILAAQLGGSDSGNNLAAVSFFLQADRGLGGFHGQRAGTTIKGQANQPTQLQAPRLGDSSGTRVDIPVDVEVSLAADGSVGRVEVGVVSSEMVDDAVTFFGSLLDNKQVVLSSEPLGKATHVIEVDQMGERKLVRRRYSSR